MWQQLLLTQGGALGQHITLVAYTTGFLGSGRAALGSGLMSMALNGTWVGVLCTPFVDAWGDATLGEGWGSFTWTTCRKGKGSQGKFRTSQLMGWTVVTAASRAGKIIILANQAAFLSSPAAVPASSKQSPGQCLTCPITNI